MPQVRYVGPFAEVEIASAGRTWRVAQGDTVDVPDDVAAGLAGQDESWEPVTSRKAKPAREGADNKEQA